MLRIFIDFKGAFDNLSWKEIKVWVSYFRDLKVCVVGGANRVKRCVDDVHKELSVDRRFGT